MPRGYRCIILAALGWLILAASPAPNSSSQAEQGEAPANVERSLESIAGAQNEIAKAAQPGEYEQPCRNGERNYKSDLCAQWYAANAAGEAADWAKWSLIVGVLGTIGIGVALGLTIQSNRIALNTARLQLRAYLTSGKATLKWVNKKGAGGKELKCTVVVQNTGQTPARDVKLDWNCWLGYSIIDCKRPPVFLPKIDRRFLAPSSPMSAIVWLPINPEQEKLLSNHQCMVICELNIEYTTFENVEVKEGPYYSFATAAHIKRGRPAFITSEMLAAAEKDSDQGSFNLFG